VTVALLASDLMIASRIAVAAEHAQVPLVQVKDPSDLPPAMEATLLLVDWSAREGDWGDRITAWCARVPKSARPRIILFGPHVDLEAHAAARASGLGPMWARSRLVSELPALLRLPAY
jgi:hypothetical protein